MSRKLLSIVELGGYPDFTAVYREGFEILTAASLRKGLALMREERPDVVVSEFRYGPTYGSQLSNLESLMAAMQRYCPGARLIIFYDPDEAFHLQKLSGRFPIHASLAFPIKIDALKNALCFD
jgi:hypothetical protein